jgi:tRNA threonylcarbamoyladenosine biosynthesis protein TsaE
MILEINEISSLPGVVSTFLETIGTRKHFAVFGPMGVGKTTFIKEVCKQLGVIQVVTSPTFALVNEYSTQKGEKIYHFDFYRITKQEELYDLGYEDYLYADTYCFIEWPEKAEELIPPHFSNIHFMELVTGQRQLEMNIE